MPVFSVPEATGCSKLKPRKLVQAATLLAPIYVHPVLSTGQIITLRNSVVFLSHSRQNEKLYIKLLLGLFLLNNSS
jgi:hypothetical protein